MPVAKFEPNGFQNVNSRLRKLKCIRRTDMMSKRAILAVTPRDIARINILNNLFFLGKRLETDY